MNYINSKKYQFVFSYETKKGKKWGYRYKYYNFLNERKESSQRGFDTEQLAYKSLLDIQSKIANGSFNEVANNKTKVKDWMAIWYETFEDDWKINSQSQRMNAIHKHINPLIGDYTLSKLDLVTYKRKFIKPLLEKYKPSTVDLLHSIFMVAINAAVNNETLDKNRLRDVRIPKPKKSENFLTVTQLSHFLKFTKENENITNYTLVLLLAYSGMRIGELLGLTPDDIDFKKNVISINRTRDGKGVRSPKTKNSYRKIKMDQVVMDQLRKYMIWLKAEKLQYGHKLQKDDFFFCSYQTGERLASTTPTALFRRLSKVLDVKITPHGLRHTHATLLLRDKKPVISVAKRLGNTPDMVMNIYGHVLDDMEDDLVDSFSDTLNGFNSESGELTGEHFIN